MAAVAPPVVRGEDPRYDDLTLVVPTYNEAENIPVLLGETARLLPGARVVVADDDSTDATRDAVLGHREDVEVTLLHRVGEDRGLTASVADALLRVETAWFVVLDADLQHPLEAVPRLVARLREGADLVVATRSSDASLSWVRRQVSRTARFLARRHLQRRTGKRVNDAMSGFFAGRTDAIRPVVAAHGHRFERSGFKVLMDVLLHAPPQVRLAEVPYAFQPRVAGESKLGRRHYFSFLRQLGTTGRLTASFLEMILSGILYRFFLVGASGVGINLFALFALHEAAGFPVAAAAPAAIELSVLWNFAWNESWTFRGRDTATRMGTRLAQFHVASAAGMILQFGILTGGTLLWPHVHYIAWSLLGIAAGSAANFLINLHWTWGLPQEE